MHPELQSEADLLLSADIPQSRDAQWSADISQSADAQWFTVLVVEQDIPPTELIIPPAETAEASLVKVTNTTFVAEEVNAAEAVVAEETDGLTATYLLVTTIPSSFVVAALTVEIAMDV
jgi:hypothetical protein